MNHSKPSRRAVLNTLATGAVGAAAASTWVETLTALARQHAHTHAGQSAIAAQDWKPRILDPQQNELVVTVTELIIPATDTPGAKAALVNRFIDNVLHEARPAERESFLKGLAWIDARSLTLFKQTFVTARPADQVQLLTALSTDANPAKEEAIGREFFRAIKSMTINGYYTSQIGLRQELGDNGQLFLPQFQGCDHPEHQ